MIVFEWRMPDGSEGRCDESCHKGSLRCSCMCGGILHGAERRPGGLHRALADHFDAAERRARLMAGYSRAQLTVHPPQLEIFGLVIPKADLTTPLPFTEAH